MTKVALDVQCQMSHCGVRRSSPAETPEKADPLVLYPVLLLIAIF